MTTYETTNTNEDLAWIIDRFVHETPGVSDAVAVSSDGLLMGASSTLDRAGAERLGALIAGFVSLGRGACQAFAFRRVEHVMVAMDGGFLIMSSVADGSCLGVLAQREANVGAVGHQVALLTERVGAALTPDVVAHPLS